MEAGGNEAALTQQLQQMRDAERAIRAKYG